MYPNPEVNPLFYNVNVCQQCRFSFTDDFSPYFAPGTIVAFQSQISAKWNKRSFSSERDIDDAIRNFSCVIEQQRTTKDPKVVEMAKDRWQEMKTEKEVNASMSYKNKKNPHEAGSFTIL